MSLKEKIKKWAREYLKEDEACSPKKSRDLRAVCFESKDPVGNGKHHEYTFQCTEWNNGEGYDVSINWYYKPPKGKSVENEKTISLNRREIEGIFACLDDMGEFEID